MRRSRLTGGFLHAIELSYLAVRIDVHQRITETELQLPRIEGVDIDVLSVETGRKSPFDQFEDSLAQHRAVPCKPVGFGGAGRVGQRD